MRNFFVFMIALAVNGATLKAQTQVQTTIDIDIEGLGDGRVMVGFTTSPELSPQGNSLNVDTLAQNGRLVVHPPIEGLNIVRVYLKQFDMIVPLEGGGSLTFGANGGRIDFPLMPGDNINVRGRIVDGHVEADVTGTEAAVVATNLEWETLAERIFYDSLSVAVVGPNGIGEEGYRRLEREYNEYLNAKYGDKPLPALEWLMEHSDSPVAGYVLAWHSYTISEMLERDPEMVERARTGIYGPMIDARLRRMEVAKEVASELSEGDAAPQFTLPLPDGSMLSLADVKKDYIVVDFWASWCGPCISGFPKMKEYYELYGDRLEIVGIATNDNRSAWLGVLAKHRLPWTNLLDIDNAVAKRYGARSLPTKIILDADCSVVAIFVGEGEEFYNKLDKLLK